MANGLVIVEFLKSWSPYNNGDIAGFNKETAEALIEKKFAKRHSKQSKGKESSA